MHAERSDGGDPIVGAARKAMQLDTDTSDRDFLPGTLPVAQQLKASFYVDDARLCCSRRLPSWTVVIRTMLQPPMLSLTLTLRLTSSLT